ncbi:MAG: hypothetical protein IPG89_06080 [Bacteroidetes bacterium]|nr:hypothetical protein [Bacteroidota bacterium]
MFFEQFTVKDLGVEAAINLVHQQINDAINNANQQLAELHENLPNWIPDWLQDAIIATTQFILNGLEVLLNTFYAVINTLNQYLHPNILINNTDAKLLYNSVGNNVLYFNNCISSSPGEEDQIVLILVQNSTLEFIYVIFCTKQIKLYHPFWLFISTTNFQGTG